LLERLNLQLNMLPPLAAVDLPCTQSHKRPDRSRCRPSLAAPTGEGGRRQRHNRLKPFGTLLGEGDHSLQVLDFMLGATHALDDRPQLPRHLLGARQPPLKEATAAAGRIRMRASN
jgi:hypothetical protein